MCFHDPRPFSITSIFLVFCFRVPQLIYGHSLSIFRKKKKKKNLDTFPQGGKLALTFTSVAILIFTNESLTRDLITPEKTSFFVTTALNINAKLRDEVFIVIIK